MNRLRSLLLSCPRWMAVSGITAVSMLGSVVATVVAVTLSGAEPHWPSALAIAALIPAVVAPASSWPVISILHDMEIARGEAIRHASTDLLTGLLSRRRFIEIAEAQFAAALASQQPLAVVLLDIDDFKQINDQYGHRAGDEVLTLVARNCAAALRPGDHLARWGGEEFVALLPGTATGAAIGVAQLLRDAICNSSLRVAGAELRVSASIGVASTDIGVQVLDRLLVMADRAMYDVKRNGKNRVMAAGDQHGTGIHAALRRH